MSIDYCVRISALSDVDALSKQWQHLEAKSSNTVFLSWGWVSAWLSLLTEAVDVLTVSKGEVLIAIGLLATNSHKRHGFSSRTLHLHETGDPLKDQPWIEYNGLLTHRGYEHEAIVEAVNFLQLHYPDWDEWVLGAITQESAEQYIVAGDFLVHELWSAPSYGVDLLPLSRAKQDYLSTLSKNTRAQIRRSLRAYQTLGDVRLVFANSKEMAISYFDQAAAWHKTRWGSEIGQSGYANRHFVDFHHALITQLWGAGQVELCALYAGEQIIGYFYNFLYKQQVSFYLSALDLPDDSTKKPGLLGHALLIQHYADKGFHYYDFMAGDARYKKSLGQFSQQLVKLALQKKQAKFYLEATARRLKHTWRTAWQK